MVTPTYDFNKIQWAWTETADGYSAEATIPCTNGHPDLKLTATVTKENKDPTCTEAGSITYTATITYEGKDYKGTKEVTLDPLGHDYDLDNVEWAWAEAEGGGYTAQLKVTCKRDQYVETVDAKVATKITDPTKTEKGTAAYVAAVSFGGKDYTDSKSVDILSFDDLDALIKDHSGAMPYDGSFLTDAKNTYDHYYSDAAKTAYGKDIDALYATWATHYGIVNKVSSFTNEIGGADLASNEEVQDSLLGKVRHLTLNEGLTSPTDLNFRIQEKTDVSKDAKGLVLYLKGIPDANIAPTIGKVDDQTNGYGKIRLSGHGQYETMWGSISIDYIGNGWSAFYFNQAELFNDLRNATGEEYTSLGFAPKWDSNDIYMSPIYEIKSSAIYGSDVEAFPNAADYTQNFNNISYGWGNKNGTKNSHTVGQRTYDHPLYGDNVFEGKGNQPLEFGMVGADASATALKKMVDGTLTSAYFYVYTSVPVLTADFRYRSYGEWTKINDAVELDGAGWHKVKIDKAEVLAALNASDGNQEDYLWFNVKAGNENNDVMRMTGVYGTI